MERLKADLEKSKGDRTVLEAPKSRRPARLTSGADMKDDENDNMEWEKEDEVLSFFRYRYYCLISFQEDEEEEEELDETEAKEYEELMQFLRQPK